MAISKKIVDTRSLADKGRFGDTKMRNVDGELSHVNAYEAYLVDNYGQRGERAVEDRGAGTINPETGRREYWHGGNHWDEFWAGASDVYESTLGKQGLTGAVTGMFKNIPYIDDYFKEGWEYVTQSGGTQWMGTGPSEGKLLERQAKGIMAGGMENLLTQEQQYRGPEGFLGREQELREQKLKDILDTGMGKFDIAGKKIDVSKKKLAGATGAAYGQAVTAGTGQKAATDLAYSGTVEEKIKESKKDIFKNYTSGIEDILLEKDVITAGKTELQKIYGTGMDTSALAAEKGEADFMAGLRKQLNQMLIDYQGATGEAYGGGAALNELNTLFDRYTANV